MSDTFADILQEIAEGTMELAQNMRTTLDDLDTQRKECLAKMAEGYRKAEEVKP